MIKNVSLVSTVVVIPARNEERRIARCLAALAIQRIDNFAIVLVANNCTDRTVSIALEVAGALELKLGILQCTLPDGAGAGTARRLGFNHAMKMWPQAQDILTTDADCLVSADWIERNRKHLRDVEAVCGRVQPMASEMSVLENIEIAPAEMEGRYERLVTEFYRRLRPGPFGLEGDHGCAAGASLAITIKSYCAIGGFADLATGEDRDIVRRLKSAGCAVRHAGDVRVAASCRLDGRAEGGMAEALRARAGHTDYLIDNALPPAKMLIDAAKTDSLGPWPLQVARQDRLRARDLAPHIALMESALRALPPVVTSLIADFASDTPSPSLSNHRGGETA